MRFFIVVTAIVAVHLHHDLAFAQYEYDSRRVCENACHCGSLWDRAEIFGDWLGLRSSLAQRGIVAHSSLTQFFQSVTSGGADQISPYGGKLDLFVMADTEKMGLWHGGKFVIHAADWQFGENVVAGLQAMAPANANSVTPRTEGGFALTTLLYEQELGHGFIATAGRVNTLDFWEMLYPDYGRGVDGFMSMPINLPMNSAPSMPFICNAAGVIKGGKRGIEAAFLVQESNHVPVTVGLDFPNGVTFVALARKYTEFFCLPGHHTLLASYATGDYISFDTSGWYVLPGGGVVPAEQSGSGMCSYIAEQRLWVDSCNEKRYTKLFGRIGISDENTSPFALSGSLALEAFGPVNCRPNDRMGIGYFYNGLHTNFKSLFAATNPLQDVHGGEAYYNAAITPWFHLTADLQVVNVPAQANDTAVILGLRGKIDL